MNDYITFAKPTLEKEEKMNIQDVFKHAVNVITPLRDNDGCTSDVFFIEGKSILCH